MIGDDGVINLRDDSNQEVEHDDQIQELVEEPYKPNESDYDVLLDLDYWCGFIVHRGAPAGIHRRSDVSNGVAVSLQNISE